MQKPYLIVVNHEYEDADYCAAFFTKDPIKVKKLLLDIEEGELDGMVLCLDKLDRIIDINIEVNTTVEVGYEEFDE